MIQTNRESKETFLPLASELILGVETRRCSVAGNVEGSLLLRFESVLCPSELCVRQLFWNLTSDL